MKSTIIAVSFLIAAPLLAQTADTEKPVQPLSPSQPKVLAASPDNTASNLSQQSVSRDSQRSYVLGANDQLSVRVLDEEEFADKPIQVDMSGFIRLPLIGRVKVSGLTAQQLEAEISTRLKTFVKDPDVTVSVTDSHSQPVSIIGSVRNPGVMQLQGHKTLVEILSMAGGPTEDAGYSVKITRHIEYGRIPLPGAADDPTGRFSIAQVGLANIEDARNPEENITICPEDTVSVPKAEMIYVLGTVPKAGAYVLHERQSLSALQALALAGGTDHYALPQKARIMRLVPGNASRAEIRIDLRAIMNGRAGDVSLLPQDILFIPSSTAEKAFARIGETALQAGSFAIYRF